VTMTSRATAATPPRTLPRYQDLPRLTVAPSSRFALRERLGKPMVRRDFIRRTALATSAFMATSLVRASRLGAAPAQPAPSDCVSTFTSVIQHSDATKTTPCVGPGSSNYAETHDCNPACGPTPTVHFDYCRKNASGFPKPHSVANCAGSSGKRFARRPNACMPSTWPTADGWLWSPGGGTGCEAYPCSGTRTFGCLDGWYNPGNGSGWRPTICRSYKCG
jgi:hypothetical protein